MPLKSLSKVSVGASRFNRLPNGFKRSSKLTQTMPIDGDNVASIRVVIGTTAVGTGVFNRSATVSTSIGVTASGQQTDQQHYGTATVGVVISSTASASVTSTHSGTATASIVITTTAAGETGATHAGTASIGVSILATASGTASQTHTGTASCQVNLSVSASGFNTNTTVPDETSNGNNMVLVGASPSFTSDSAIGTRATEFDRNYSLSNHPDSEAGRIDDTFEDVFDSPFSVSMWIKPSDGQPQSLNILFDTYSGHVSGVVDYQFMLKLETDGKIHCLFRKYTGSTALSNNCETVSAAFTNGSQSSYKHIVLTVDSSAIPTIYVNGTANNTNSTSGGGWSDLSNYVSTNDCIGVGARYTSSTSNAFNSFDGKIDDVSLWSKELTSTEVSNLYNSGSGSSLTGSSDLEGWWKMGDHSVLPVTHSGTATVSVAVTASASGETFTTHSGTASCQVNLSASASGTVTSPDYEQEVSEITSLKGWFDANKPNGTDQTGFTNGTAVTTWTSRVGTSVTLGQSTASAKPTWNTNQINSLPAIDCAVGDWLNSTSTDIKDIVHGQNNIAITTYVVMQVDNYPSSSASGDAMVLGWEDTVTSVGSQDVFHLPRIERGTGYLQLLERAGGTGLTNLAGYEYQTALGTGSYKYFGCIAGATSITLRVNGSEQTLSNYLGGTWNTAQTHDAHQLQVGGFSNAGGSQILLDGKIAEILIFNSTLGSTDIASVENYITDKYNL